MWGGELRSFNGFVVMDSYAVIGCGDKGSSRYRAC